MFIYYNISYSLKIIQDYLIKQYDERIFVLQYNRS